MYVGSHKQKHPLEQEDWKCAAAHERVVERVDSPRRRGVRGSQQGPPELCDFVTLVPLSLQYYGKLQSYSYAEFHTQDG